MKEKLVFPTKNPMGRVFNDFMNRVPLVETYKEKGEIIQQCIEATTIRTENGDMIQVVVGGTSVNYTTETETVFREMLDFITKNFKYKEMFGDNLIMINSKAGIELYMNRIIKSPYAIMCAWAL